MRYSFKTKTLKALKKRHYECSDGYFYKNKQSYNNCLGEITNDTYLDLDEINRVFINCIREKCVFRADGTYIPTLAIKEFITPETHPEEFV